MKRIALLLAGLMMATLAWADKTLHVVTEPWPPFIIEGEGGNISGFDYEVSAAVLEQMGYSIELEILPWKRVIQAVQEKQADAVLGIINNEERQAFLHFPGTPLSRGGNVVFFAKERPFDYQGIDSLAGKTLGTMRGYTYSPEFDQATGFTKVPLTGSNGLERNFQKLLAGRVDLVIEQESVGLYTAKQMGLLDKIDYSRNYVSDPEGNHLAFAKQDGHDRLAKEFGEAVKAFKQTDEYRAIMARYGQ